MKHLGAPIAAALLLAALTGCSSTATAAGEHTSSPAPTKVMAVSYSSVTDLKTAYVKAGGKCPSWDQNNVVQTAAESGDCSDSTVLSTYADEGSKTDAVTALKGFATSDVPAVFLVGPNWIVNSEDAKAVAKKLGGTIVTSTGSSDQSTASSSDYEYSEDTFTISLKTVSKECFDTAGCVVTVQPLLSTSDDSIPDDATGSLTYEITGGNDGASTESIDLTGSKYSVNRSVVDTPSKGTKLHIKITDVQTFG